MKLRENDEGWREILIENMDDLWYLKNIIDPETTIRKSVMRREEKSEDMERSKETPRKPVLLEIKPEEVHFQPFTDRLRIQGIIINGPEGTLGQHQSIYVSEGENIEIMKKKWDRSSESLIKDALLKVSNNALFIVMDDESATFCILREYGLQAQAKIFSGKSGKEYAGNYSRKAYFDEILKTLNSMKFSGPVIVTGPGFEGEMFEKSLKEKKTELESHFIPSTRDDENAVYEIINTDAVRKITGDSRASKERRYMEQFLEGLSKNSMVAYGKDEISRLSQTGAIGKLLVLEDNFRNKDFQDIMDNVHISGGEIIIMSSEGEYGKTLKNFASMVALLRYNL